MSKKKLKARVAAAAAFATTATISATSFGQSFSAASYAGPGTLYVQDFNTLPFVIQNARDANGAVLPAGLSGSNGTQTLPRPLNASTIGPAYDLGTSVNPDPTTFASQINSGTNVAGSNILLDAFLLATVNAYPTGGANAIGDTGNVYTSVSATTSVIPTLTQSQAVSLAQRASTSLRGWGVVQYGSNTANGGFALRFGVDTGGPSNSGRIASFGPSAQGLLQNGVFVQSVSTNADTGVTAVGSTISESLIGSTFDPTSTDTTAYPFLDRALGALASGSGRNALTFTIRNDSTSVLTSIDVSTLLETWRKGSTTQTNEGFTASYLISDSAPTSALLSADINDSVTFTPAPSLNVLSDSQTLSSASSTATYNGTLVPLPLSASVNGQAAAISRSGSLPVTIFPGQYLTLRYQDVDNQGVDNGVALDNFTFSATGAAVAAGAKFLTYTAAVNNTVAVGGAANFVTNGASATLATGDVLTFDNTGLGAGNATVNIDNGGISLSQFTFANTSGTYTVNGGSVNSTIGLIKTGAGTVILNNASNSLGTFGLRASGGTVGFSTQAQIGGSGATIVLSGGATLESRAVSSLDLSTTSVSLAGVGGGFSNTNPVTLGGVSGTGTLVKSGSGTLTLNGFNVFGGFILNGGSLVFNLPAGQAINLTPNANQLNGDLVLATASRLNLNTLASANGNTGGVLSGTGQIFVDASGATISTADNNNVVFFTSIQTPIILNRNNLPNFVFNIFPGFAGASRLQVDTTISGPGGAPANASINFAPGIANGNGSLVLTRSLSYTGTTTINTIGATSGLGGPVILGAENIFPVTTTLGFNTATGFNQGSSGTGYLSLGNSLANAGNGGSFSQTLAGLYSGTGDAPRNSVANARTAFGGINNNVTGTDPLATQLTLNIAAGNTFTYTGQLLGALSIIKTGPGFQRLGAVYAPGSNTLPQTSNYTGTTEIRQGTIEAFGGDNRLSFNAPLVLGTTTTTGTLILSGISQTVSALSSSNSLANRIIGNVGNINGTDTATATLVVRSPDFNDGSTFVQSQYRDFNTTTFAGTLTDGTGQLSLVKTANQSATDAPAGSLGELRLSGSLAYSGNTTVNGGHLVVLTPLRPLAVNPATLQGNLVASGPNAQLTIGVSSTGTGAVIAAQVNTFTATGGAIVQVQNPRFSVAGTVTNVAGPSVIVANTVSIDATSSVNLGTSDLIVQAGTVSAIRDLVSAWFTGGTRAGTTGLLTTASGPGVPAANLTTLAVFSNDAGNGLPYFNSYDGVSLTTSSIIVKYTYLGDTNLDGVVNGSDLANLIEGLSTPGASSYAQGDLNYDGAVTLSDLALFNSVYDDVSVISQLAPLGGGSALGGLYGAVPEPSGLLAVLPAAAMLGRRRRRA